MTVYIEYVLIDNFVIDYLMLKATFATTGKNVVKRWLFLSSFLGAVIALIYPLIQVHTAILTCIKICSGLLMVLISTRFSSPKSYYVHAVLFFFYTFLTGGVITGVFEIFNIPKNSEINIAFMAIFVYAVICAVMGVVKYVYRRKDVVSVTCRVDITAFGQMKIAKGFFDTGNGLYDGDSPVIICNKKFAEYFLFCDLSNKKIKKITVNTVNGKEDKFAFKIDSIKIYNGTRPNIYNNVVMCIADNIGEGYDVILHPALARMVDDEIDSKIKKVS